MYPVVVTVKGSRYGGKGGGHTDSGRGGDGPGRVTLKDIAKELGVAVSTVSNAYNRPDQLSDSLRSTVLETAARLGYCGPDPAARGLRRGVSNVIGVAYPSQLAYAFTDPGAALLIEGVAHEAEAAGLALLLIGMPDVSGAGAPLPITTANVDGLIVHSFAEGDPLYGAAIARRLPMVMVDNPAIDGMPSVSIDDEGGARAAAEHLLARGHTRLGIASLEFTFNAVGGIADSARQAQASYLAVRARLAGYRAAVEAAGLDWTRDVVVFETTNHRTEDGEIAAAALLEQEPRPTAILAMSDQLAFGVLAHLRRSGIEVPAEVAVVGYDDLPAAALHTPALTTVHQPTREKGRQAGRLMVGLLRGEGPLKSVSLPTRLVVRESS